MKEYSVLTSVIIGILIIIGNHGSVIAKLTQFNTTTDVPSIPLPLDRWLPDADLEITGILRSCPGPTEKPDPLEWTRYQQEIPVCYLNTTAHYKTLEDAMRMCGRFHFPALVILNGRRAGLGWRKTDASRDAPQIPTVEITESLFAVTDMSLPVTIDFSEGNYALEFQSGGGWIVEEIVYAVGTFIAFPLLTFAAVAHYYKHGKFTIPVAAYALSALSNIPRFTGSLDLYNTQRMYHYCFQRATWTIPLPMTISATALFCVVEDQVLTKAMKYADGSSSCWNGWINVRYWGFIAYAIVTPSLDGIFSIYNCYGGDVQSWTGYPVIGLLIVGNVFVMVYSVIMYVRLRRAMEKIQDSPRRQKALNRLKWTRITLGVLSFVWVVFLGFHWFSEGIRDNNVYIRTVLPVGWTGIFFALCMCYVHLFILKLPTAVFIRSHSGTTGSTNHRSGGATGNATSSNTKKSTTSTSSTLAVSEERDCIPMETM